MGPISQLKKMFAATRIIATIVMFVSSKNNLRIKNCQSKTHTMKYYPRKSMLFNQKKKKIFLIEKWYNNERYAYF